MNPQGFDGQFTLLFDDDMHEQPHLPEPIRAIYQGDWHPLSHPDRPYTFMNFVTSRDGRVSYNEPGQVSGAYVACFSKADIWVMGLLRARADAIMMGQGTLHSAPHELWTYDAIFPAERDAFGAMRAYYGLPPVPLHIFVSLDGTLDPEAAVFHQPELNIIIATTYHGQAEASTRLRTCPAAIEFLDLGMEAVDFKALSQLLFSQYGVRMLLCEGGPRVYGSLLSAGLVDDEFLTLSPTVVGEQPGKFRPSLIEGMAFAPERAPRSRLLSMRRTGDHLFLRSRWSYQQAAENSRL